MISSKNILYIGGNKYNVLSITKKEAQKHGIDDPQHVTIEEVQNGILIKRKSAAGIEADGSVLD
jgi:hypothetical protein